MFCQSLQQLIESFKRLPGVGQKSAQRMALFLLERDRKGAQKISHAIQQALAQIVYCKRCHNLADEEICALCKNPKRDAQQLCIVESPSDVIAIEQSGCFSGHYFVLLGHLSPIDGIGPAQLGLDVLKARLTEGIIKELILATNTTVEGEATAHYILDLVREFSIKTSRIAHGIPLGGELEYIDAGTISRAIKHRSPLYD